MSLSRREFGKRVLEVAAALGVPSVGPGLVGALQGCGADPMLGGFDGGGPGAGGPDSGGPMGDADIADGPQFVDTPLDASLDAADGSTAGTNHVRVAIVGSGYGSAVAALRLTEAGIPVTLFEMGRIWNKPGPDGKIFASLSATDGRTMWFRDSLDVNFSSFFGLFPTDLPIPNEAGILDVRGPESMRCWMGRGLGGGSLVNLAIYVPSTRDVLARALPAVDADRMFDTYYPRALERLRANVVTHDLLAADIHTYSRVGAAAAETIGVQSEPQLSGYDYDYLRAELEGKVPVSASVGEGGFGNNFGKRSLDKTYLAEALATGLLTIHSLTEVRRITEGPSGGYVLHVKQIDIQGAVLAERELSFTHAFIGAGSYGSSELLVRSRERGDLPKLNDAVGTEWGPNSDIFVGRYNNNPANGTGPAQCTVPGYAWHARDQHDDPFFSMVIPFPVGIETFMSFNICVTESPEAGHFTYDSTTDEVSLNWLEGQQDDAVERVRHFFDRINVRSHSDYNASFFNTEKDVGEKGTYHPVGGVPLSRATDDWGRVRNYENLYVVDSSLLPIAIGGNPALTTAALAERNMERILAEDFQARAGSCLVAGCGPLIEPVCESPRDIDQLATQRRVVVALWSKDSPAALEGALGNVIVPAIDELVRELTTYLHAPALSAYAATPLGPASDLQFRGFAVMKVVREEDLQAVLDTFETVVERAAAYEVDASEAASYDRAWRDGEPSPGAQVVSRMRRKPSLSPQDFKERWYCQATHPLVRLHPTWSYGRWLVVRPLSSGAPDYDGFSVLHVQRASELSDPEAYFNGRRAENEPRSAELLQAFVDMDSLEVTATTERIWKSGYLL